MGKGRKRVLIWGTLLCWAGLVTVPVSYLMAEHLSCYGGSDGAILITQFAKQAEGVEWSVNHVLSADCKCSLEVAEYLIERQSEDSTNEVVILMDGDEAFKRRFEGAGFRVALVDSGEFCKQFNSSLVPYFQILNADHDLEVSSGYSTEIARGADLEALVAIKRGQEFETVESEYCEVSRSLIQFKYFN